MSVQAVQNINLELSLSPLISLNDFESKPTKYKGGWIQQKTLWVSGEEKSPCVEPFF